MQVIEHKVIVHGPAVRESGLEPAAAGGVLQRLEQSLRGAVEVAFRRSSTAGRRQRWLRKAGEFEFKDLERTGNEEMALYFTAKPFGEVAQDYYAQAKLFEDGPNADDTAFDVFGDAVGDVMAEKADSDKYDVGLLKRFYKFESAVYERDVHELLISGHRVAASHPRRLSPAFPRHARALYLKTPEPSRVRIAGRLDMIEASTMAFSLVLPGGEKVRGVWRGSDFETLRGLVNSDVAAAGMAVYRPSGTLLRIDADTLASQQEADRFFATVPVPTGGKLDFKSLLREQRARGGMAALGGMLPAEESDEEFLAAIAEMD